MAQLGRREDALTASGEAVEMYREVAAARPEAFGPDLARALNTQSNCLAELGQREDALSRSPQSWSKVLPPSKSPSFVEVSES